MLEALSLLRSFLAASLCVLATTACSDSEPGGTRTADDAGSAAKADGKVDGATSDVPQPERPATWTELYRDYFGPTAPSRCAGDGQCHGGSSQSGTQSSGFLCETQTGCRQGLIDSQKITPGGRFEDSALYSALRKQDSGYMPLRPDTYVFSPASLALIGSWVAAGAPND